MNLIPVRHRIVPELRDQYKAPGPGPAPRTAPTTAPGTEGENGLKVITITKKKQISAVPWQVPAVLPYDPWIVASFDIGVKTLSYCVMSRDKSKPDGSVYEIYDWDIIDLMPSETKHLVCEYPLGSGKRKGQPCGKKASYSYSPVLIPIKVRQVGGQEPSPLVKDGVSPNPMTLKGACKTHASKIPGTSVIREKRVDNMTNLELNIEVVKQLDRRPIFLEVDEVLLEHQPSKNPRMKNLSYMLHSYFALRGLVDREEVGRLQNVRFISPKNKLNVYDGPDVAKKYKNPYDENKYRSKLYTEYIIRDDSRSLAYFTDSHKKRDDLGDAFLQGAWFLKKQRK